MAKRYLLIISLLTLSLISMGHPPIAIADPTTAAVKANNALTFDVYSKIDSSSENVFFSPLSIFSALSMTMAGANGETLTEMRSTMGVGGSDDELFSGIESIRQTLQAVGQGENTLRIANSLWVQSGYELLQTYHEVVKKYFQSELNEVDYASNPGEARSKINSWVSKKTADKIPELLSEDVVTTDTRTILVNAVYFLGKWAMPFDGENTRPDRFNYPDGSSENASFMSEMGHFLYSESREAQFIELPYLGGDFVMNIALPRELGDASISSLASHEKIATYIEALKSEKVALRIPKFRAEASFRLAQALTALGMKSAFTFGPADFSKMNGNKDFFIGEVIHQAFVDVNEKGTEAAAATAVAMRAGAAPKQQEEQPKIFRADHAFLIFIREKKTGTIIFMGRINKVAPAK